MKIRTIKKLAKNGKIKTNSLKSWFVKSLEHSKSIRNVVIRGMIRNGDESSALRLILKFDVLPKFKGRWELVKYLNLTVNIPQNK